jgi:hypothetical protein
MAMIEEERNSGENEVMASCQSCRSFQAVQFELAPMLNLDCFPSAPPCTVHLVSDWFIALHSLARAGPLGATLSPLCFEHLGGTSAPAGWPRWKPGGELRL